MLIDNQELQIYSEKKKKKKKGRKLQRYHTSASEIRISLTYF